MAFFSEEVAITIYIYIYIVIATSSQKKAISIMFGYARATGSPKAAQLLMTSGKNVTVRSTM